MPALLMEDNEHQPLVRDVNYGTKQEQLKPDAIQLFWNKITIKQNQSTKSRNIVDGASGEAIPGDLLAIMGPSGVGKTSLLNALSFKNLAGLKVTGNIFANHALVTPNNTTDVSAYVQQEDLFLGTRFFKEM